MEPSPIVLTSVLCLHALDALLVCRLLGLRGDDAFWGGVLAIFLQWGAIATALSLLRALTTGGWVLSLLLITAAVLALAARRAGRRPPGDVAERAARVSRPPSGLASPAVALLAAAAFVVQWGTPLSKGDDLMYHGSRVLYWVQQRSLLPFETHNDRHNVFPFAGELPFLVGVLLSRSERLARVLHLSALPLVLWGIVRLGRSLGVRPALAGLLPLLFLATPLVLAAADGIGVELWTTVGLLAALHWLLRAGDASAGASVLPALGASTALAVSFKLTLLPLLGLGALAVAIAPRPEKRAAWRPRGPGARRVPACWAGSRSRSPGTSRCTGTRSAPSACARRTPPSWVGAKSSFTARACRS